MDVPSWIHMALSLAATIVPSSPHSCATGATAACVAGMAFGVTGDMASAVHFALHEIAPCILPIILCSRRSGCSS
jgi:hypothetical protein